MFSEFNREPLKNAPEGLAFAKLPIEFLTLAGHLSAKVNEIQRILNFEMHEETDLAERLTILYFFVFHRSSRGRAFQSYSAIITVWGWPVSRFRSTWHFQPHSPFSDAAGSARPAVPSVW